jgi:hypothetical protein
MIRTIIVNIPHEPKDIYNFTKLYKCSEFKKFPGGILWEKSKKF